MDDRETVTINATTATPVKKPAVLVVTELYPKTPNDHVGAFVKDQLEMLLKWYDITVITVHQGRELFDRQPKFKGHRMDGGIDVYSIPYYQWWVLVWPAFKIIPIYRMLAINKKITAWKIRRLAKQLHQHKHFVFVHGHETYFGDEAGPIGQALRIPSIFTLHGFYQEHLKNFGPLLMASAIANIKHVNILLADSSMASKTYEPQVGRSFTPIPNGLDPLPAGNLPDEIEKFIGQHPLLLSVGALSPSKRFDISVHALAAIHKAGHTDYRLIINGRGTEEQKIRELAKSLNLQSAILITSGLSRAALRGLFERADIVLHPSVVEAFCIVVLEGMAAGKPVVATSSIGIMDYLKIGQDVMAVPPNDIEKFSAAVIELIEQPDKKISMGRTAGQSAKQFTWQAVADRLHVLYQPLIAE